MGPQPPQALIARTARRRRMRESPIRLKPARQSEGVAAPSWSVKDLALGYAEIAGEVRGVHPGCKPMGPVSPTALEFWTLVRRALSFGIIVWSFTAVAGWEAERHLKRRSEVEALIGEISQGQNVQGAISKI